MINRMISQNGIKSVLFKRQIHHISMDSIDREIFLFCLLSQNIKPIFRQVKSGNIKTIFSKENTMSSHSTAQIQDVFKPFFLPSVYKVINILRRHMPKVILYLFPIPSSVF